jgi:uncharacterized repeat protein (TIGR02543 family)
MRLLCRRLRLLPLIAVGIALLATLPASSFGRTTPFAEDGSTYTWPTASRLIVDVDHWGGGYVRSHPYLIDCPFACVRSVAPGTKLTLTATPTSGDYTFLGWEGACEGQGIQCELTVPAGDVHVTARFKAPYFPPPADPAPVMTPDVDEPIEEEEQEDPHACVPEGPDVWLPSNGSLNDLPVTPCLDPEVPCTPLWDGHDVFVGFDCGEARTEA